MAIYIKEFGKTREGRIVKKYTISNANGVSASFLDYGAIWKEMLLPEKEGHHNVVLGYDSMEEYEKDRAQMGAIVGRNAGRVSDGMCMIQGKLYSLEKNEGKNNLHSGPKYWGKRVWEASVDEKNNTVKFFLDSPDLDQGFPGNAKVCVSYTLTEDNGVKIHYDVVTDQPTICNMTSHVYFHLSVDRDVLKEKVWMDADYFLPNDYDLLSMARLCSVKDTAMDFTREKEIGRDIKSPYTKRENGYDHAWIINDCNLEVKKVAGAKDPVSGRKLTVWTDLPSIQFYTGNGLSGKFNAHSGYCFETEFVPNLSHTALLLPGEHFDKTTIFYFEF